jgi:hypothetical protein
MLSGADETITSHQIQAAETLFLAPVVLGIQVEVETRREAHLAVHQTQEVQIPPAVLQRVVLLSLRIQAARHPGILQAEIQNLQVVLVLQLLLLALPTPQATLDPQVY